MTSVGNDSVAIVVNEDQVSLSDFLRSMWVGGDLGSIHRCARQRLIVQLARCEGLCVSQTDLQAGVNEWRYRNRLERVEDTELWLTSRGLTLDDVAAEVERRWLKEALADKVTKDRIEPYFAQHTLDFDEAEAYWIRVGMEGVAEEVRTQAAEEGVAFYDLARRCSEDAETRRAGGYLGRLRRAQLPIGVAPLVFAARPGEMVGPVKVPKGYALYLVEQVYPATLTEGVRQEIRGDLFQTFLGQEMRRAKIGFPVLASLLG